MFGDPEALFVLDMSEYMEKHNVSRLIGAPPGYVGYEEGGQLTERIRRRPYSVILLDEIEKAHPDVFNMLLQIMEEGRLTDSFGRHVDFKNVVLIMTSNIGAHRIAVQDEFGFAKRDTEVNYDKMCGMLRTELEDHFRPEFINRLDEIIVFRKLTHKDMISIVDLELDKLAKRMAEKNLGLEITSEAKDFLVEHGTDEKFGARPLRRAIGTYLEDPLSEAMLRGDFDGKNKVAVSFTPPKGEDERGELTLEAVLVETKQPEAIAAHTDET